MADVRALLKAKRQEAKIKHPLASYTQSGQLRCTACGTLVKHASAWEGHLGSKAHRTNVARLKEEQRAREEQRLKEEAEAEAEKTRGKRKADEAQDSESESEADSANDGGKTAKRRKVGAAPSGGGGNGFPADFFSDPSRAPLPPDSEEEDETNVAPAPPEHPAAPPSEIDLEYERFQRELLTLNGQDKRETYERATTMAEPDIMVEQTPEGFPVQEVEDGQPELAQKLDEEAKRRQKELDERELIMDRLMDEEQTQEEADMRVTVMKARLEALKKKRETARALKKAAVS